MDTLVVGGTGTVGSRVVEALRQSGREVRVLTSSPEKAERFPEGIEGIVGDLADPDSLRPAFEGVSRVFMVTPQTMDETEMGLNAVRAGIAAGVRRFVYMTAFHLEEAPHIPMFQTKIPIQNAIKESGMEWTLLQPNHFFQNDLLLREAITEFGVYPQPLGDVGLNRADVRDIADAAVNALTQDGHSGETYPLAGPDALTGDDVAEIWSEALGREVRYGGSNLDAWATQMKLVMPSWLVYDLRILFQYVLDEGLLATDEELDQQAKVLGRPPRRFADFVSETAALWRSDNKR